MNNDTNNTNSNTSLNTSFYIPVFLKTAFFVSIQLMLASLLGFLDAALIGDAISIVIVIVGYAIDSWRSPQNINNAITILEIEKILSKRGIQVNHLENNLEHTPRHTGYLQQVLQRFGYIDAG